MLTGCFWDPSISGSENGWRWLLLVCGVRDVSLDIIMGSTRG